MRTWGVGDASSRHAFQSRTEYPSMGLRWEFGGGTHADRKRMQRWLESAEERGLIERFRGGAFATRLRMTHAADVATRAACGLAGVKAAALTVWVIEGYEYEDPDDEPADGRVWVPEYPELNGGTEHDNRRVIEEMAYPGLVRGWLEASSCMTGLVRYTTGPVACPAEVPDDPPAGDGWEALRDIWAASLNRTLGVMKKVTPDTSRDLGYIPLIAGIGGVRKKAKQRRRKAKAE